MLKPVGGVSHVRIVYPLQALRTDPTVMTQDPGSRISRPPSSDTPRIFILHRPNLSGERGAELIRGLLAEGWVIVTDFDDHPGHWGMLDAKDQLAFCVVHAVQVSTPNLATMLRAINPEVMVFPNAMRALPDLRNFVEPHPMTLFFCALNRERDWVPLLLVLNDLAEKIGYRLQFRVVHDQAFFDALSTPHKQFTPTCDYETYLTLLGQCEIALMPLRNTPFNCAKSDLKFIEAGACRVASLASPVVDGDSIDDGRTGLLFRSADELRDQLGRLLATPEQARDLGDAARRYVAAERMLAYQVAQRTGMVPFAVAAACGTEQRVGRAAGGRGRHGAITQACRG